MAKPHAAAALDVAQWKNRGSAVYLEGRATLDGTDALAREMEAKWGAGRLRLLVDDDLRAAFDRQRLKLNDAIWRGDLDDVKRESERMQNGWRALDEAAEQSGRQPKSPLVWEVSRPDGKVIALVADIHDASQVRPDGRYVDIYTLDEIANLLHGFPELVKAKQIFPGAEVVRVGPIRDPLDELSGDEIPF